MSFGEPGNPYGQQPQGPNPYGQQPQGPNPYGQQAPQGVPPQQGYGYPQAPGQPGGHPGYPQGGGMQPPYPQPGVPPIAGMGRRLGARAIDGVLYSIIYFAVIAPVFMDTVKSATDCDPASAAYDTCINNASSDMMSKIIPIALGMMAVTLVYEVLMISFVGATLGKLAVGIRVLRLEDGQKPGLGKGLLRWLIPFVGYFACGLGMLLVYVSPFFDNSGRQQGWHDKVAGTIAVHVKG
ncbi:RDD family protein [Streptomyces sp. VRA16 Mangrove soil]|uniref:RDD family protein n=1 Tax=Streptomyces sp. VRA16 Mangrove soil TaxID=2817434 RepID=UPI001A9FBC56|nr:RDD family protein [Streptomyces sp. VRA16 Mangrove soil]MBO1335145.1 RDD family protein [Streptomyces sp. VRA16 Mangrove soil]